MNDFASIPNQLRQWHEAMYGWFEGAIAAQDSQLGPQGGVVQFFNPAKFDPGTPSVEQAITWNAFPKELLRRYGRNRALVEADGLWHLSEYSPVLREDVFHRWRYRPLNEYCEWHVVREGASDRILKVTFSSEPPEYWQAMFGEAVITDDGVEYPFAGDKEKMLSLYQALVSPDVRMEDLIAPEDIVTADGAWVFARKGHYNSYNKWNTTHGIVHLCAPPNTLSAEVRLGADATITRKDGRSRMVTEPDALICCSGYGGPDRNSDPTIGAAVNALARLGAMVTLRDPVGLYMDHIDLAGWSAPDGKPVNDCVRVLRGSATMIERLEVKVPSERGFYVSDLSIGGVPIRYGGQIAECITVKLIGVAALVQPKVKIVPVSCTHRCCIDAENPSSLNRPMTMNTPVPPGTQPAFLSDGDVEKPQPLRAKKDKAGVVIKAMRRVL